MRTIIKRIEWLLSLGGTKRDVVILSVSGVSLILSIFKILPLPFDIAWVAIILCGIPIILEAIIGLVTKFDIKADVLVSLALIASIVIGEDFAAGEVAFIMQIGSLLEELTVARARAGIEKLIHLTPRTARLINNNEEKIIPSEQVKVGDILRVLPGETIPVDGTILSGQTAVNQAVMTGESMPVDKEVGDNVSSGTVNQFGTFEMRAVKVGEDSSIQRMIRLVQSADAGKAKIVGIADRWATWIVVIALASAFLTWIFTGEIIRSVTILVVFCPCALVLATPTAIMAAIGNATKHGFLVKEGDALERLAKVNTVTFDKTGTLTNGTPKVICIKSLNKDYEKAKVFELASSAEKLSEHPLGKAMVASFKEQNKAATLPEAKNFTMIPGQGVSACIEGKNIIAGNEKMMQAYNVELLLEVCKEMEVFRSNGSTVVMIACESKLIGYIVLSDTVREESKTMITKLNQLGIKSVLLTGDNKNTAESISTELGIKEVIANCLPEEKLSAIDAMQKKQQKVCMIGDGINDAPALKKADVGIAMGGVGSDIAVDAADIALVNDEVKELPHLLSLSKRMMKTIKLNLSFSMSLNFLAIVLAISGVLNPVVGALVHNCGSVLVIINSAILLKWRKK